MWVSLKLASEHCRTISRKRKVPQNTVIRVFISSRRLQAPQLPSPLGLTLLAIYVAQVLHIPRSTHPTSLQRLSSNNVPDLKSAQSNQEEVSTDHLPAMSSHSYQALSRPKQPHLILIFFHFPRRREPRPDGQQSSAGTASHTATLLRESPTRRSVHNGDVPQVPALHGRSNSPGRTRRSEKPSGRFFLSTTDTVSQRCC